MKKQSPIKILFCVVRDEKTSLANEILNSEKASACYTLQAKGVGHNDILEVMGLSDMQCSMIISAVKTEEVKNILTKLYEKLEFEKGNQGVAFCAPITAISRNALNGFMDMAKQVEKALEQEQNDKKQDIIQEEIKTDSQNLEEKKEESWYVV